MPRLTAALAVLCLLAALMVPERIGRAAPGAVLSLPVEAVLGLALLAVLPPRASRAAAVAGGTTVGMLTVLKIIDLSFSSVLNRPFDPLLDWGMINSALGYLDGAYGRTGAVMAVLTAAAVTVAVPVVLAVSVVRISRVLVGHRASAVRSAGVLAVLWLACAVLGTQLVPGVPVAGSETALLCDRARQARADLADRQRFLRAVGDDPFRATADADLLTGLRGKDVVIAFVESYGRSAVDDPRLAPQVGALLDAGDRRLSAAGFSTRTGHLTSSTVGGGSWLAHSTLLSGLWIDDQQRYRTLVSSDRLTLTGAFRRGGWRTVGVMPGATLPWPEGDFFGYDRVYDSRGLGYHGPRFSWASMPDQYTLAQFQRTERASPHAPMMAEIHLVSSHAPWSPTPRLVDWADVGDGSIFAPMAGPDAPPEAIVTRDPARVRADYRRSIEYSLDTVISYVETYGDDDLVLIVLGDHQPSPIVTGEGASRDVPVALISRDRAVVDRIADWSWTSGLRPAADTPVWPMDAFRDRFLTAFGPR